MIVIRTPTRCSLIGGGTDYPSWYSQHGGAIIGGAIRCYSTFLVRPLPPVFPHKSRLAYSKVEEVSDHHQIEHRAVRACLEEMDWLDGPGLEICHFADLPASCGVGSSSTFVVGLIHALGTLRKEYLSPAELRERATRVERQRMEECVGDQDQVLAAYGGFHRVDFRRKGEVILTPLLDEEGLADLERHLLMVYCHPRTGRASQVAATYVDQLPTRTHPQWALLRLVEDATSAIQKRDWEKLGELIGQSWKLKQLLSPAVAPPEVQEVSMRGLAHGAWGGKLMGAGGGGCFLFLCDPSRRQAILDHLPRGCIEIPLRFSPEGSRVISW